MTSPHTFWKRGLVYGLLVGVTVCIVFSLFVSFASVDYPERVTFLESLIVTLPIYGLGCAILGTLIGWLRGKRKK